MLSVSNLSKWGFYIVFVVVSYLAVAKMEHQVISTGWDKTNHLLAFFVLLALLDNAYPLMALWQKKVFLLLGYGVLIEIIQFFLPNREFSLLDVLGDIAGLLLYILLRPRLLPIVTYVETEIFKQ